MTACNNIIGIDGELLDDNTKLRTSKPAHLSINMWVLNILVLKIYKFDFSNASIVKEIH